MKNMDNQLRKDMSTRLARIEGQLRGIQRLINEGEECEKIAQQMTASRKALDKAFHTMLACLVEQAAVEGEASGQSAKEWIGEIKYLISKYA